MEQFGPIWPKTVKFRDLSKGTNSPVSKNPAVNVKVTTFSWINGTFLSGFVGFSAGFFIEMALKFGSKLFLNYGHKCSNFEIDPLKITIIMFGKDFLIWDAHGLLRDRLYI